MVATVLLPGLSQYPPSEARLQPCEVGEGGDDLLGEVLVCQDETGGILK